MSVVIVDSGGANLASLRNALTRLGAAALVTSDAAAIRSAARVILPGVGSATAAMARLRDLQLTRVIPGLQQPMLGICLGMQLLYERSEEGDVPCLGILPGQVRRIAPQPGLSVPHMGWNTLEIVRDDPLLNGFVAGSYVYFVHSYAASVDSHTLAISEHGSPLTALVRHGNFWGTQFHPERSGTAGARLLENFLRLN